MVTLCYLVIPLCVLSSLRIADLHLEPVQNLCLICRIFAFKELKKTSVTTKIVAAKPFN
jgi:hypothetical protein